MTSPETFPGADGAAWPSGWTLFSSTGSLTGFTQSGGRGRMTLPNVANYPGMGARRDGVDLRDIEVLFDVTGAFDASTLGTSEHYREVQVRLPLDGNPATGLSPCYYLSIHPANYETLTSPWYCTINRRRNGVNTPIGSSARHLPAASRAMKGRLRVTGSAVPVRLQARIWDAAAAEPTEWHIDTTDTNATEALVNSGTYAIAAYAGAATGPSAYVEWDNISVVTAGSAPTITSFTVPGTTVWPDPIPLEVGVSGTGTIAWTVTSRPAGSTATITNPGSAAASFVPDKAGRYTFAVSISNATGSDSRSASVEVGAQFWMKTSTGKVPVALRQKTSSVVVTPGTPILNTPQAQDIDTTSFLSVWTTAERATSYQVARRLVGGAFAVVATVAAPTLTYRHPLLEPNTEYEVQITPFLGTVAGTASNIVRTKTNALSVQVVEQGVYRRAGDWQQITAYEQFQGKPVQRALEFQGVDKWDNLQWPGWVSGSWKGRRKVWLGATPPVFPDSEGGIWNSSTNSWDARTGWARAARGDFDTFWQNFFNRMVLEGQGDAILRGPHEFNFQLHGYFVTPASVGDFITAFRRAVDMGRATPGADFLFEWNPTTGYEYGFPLSDPATAYPGDAWVDRIAVDAYAPWFRPRAWLPNGTVAQGNHPPTEQEITWALDWVMTDGSIPGSPWYQGNASLRRGMDFWKDFALARGKKLSLPEWGLRNWDNPLRGTGDDWRFIELMHSLISGSRPGWQGVIEAHAFWEHTPWNDTELVSGGVMDPDNRRFLPVPLSRAKWLQLFGAQATTPPDAPTIGTITAGNGKIIVPFTPAPGGALAQSYTATASTGQSSAPGSASPLEVAVPNGTPVSATVKANNAAGSSAPSAASNTVTPVAPAANQYTVVWGSKNGSTVTRPEGTYYRVEKAVGNIETDSQGDIPVAPNTTRTITVSIRQGVGTPGGGGVSFNVLRADNSYITNTGASSGNFDGLTTTFQDKAFTVVVPAEGAKVVMAVYVYNGGAIDLAPSVTVT